MRRLTLLAILSLTPLACGPTPPSVSGLGPDDPCTSDAQCQGGLECYAAVCDFTRCDDAPAPQDYCGRRLDVPPSIARCDGGECLVARAAPGEPCDLDEACTFGSACVRSTCTPTCLIDASCPAPSTRCLPRSDTPGDVSLCQEVPSCDLAQSPPAFCADALSLEPGLVTCEASSCRALEPPGELDEPCSPDFGCVAPLSCVMGVCSEPGGQGDSCSSDLDCDASSICLGETCTRGCSGGCADGEACFPRPGDAIGYCAAVDPEDCRSYPDPAARCVEISSGPSTCKGDGTCAPVRSFDFVRLSFSSYLIDDCESRELIGLPAPGPHLAGVDFLRDGSLVAYAVATSRTDDGFSNGFSSFDLFGLGPDGAALTYDDDGCPDPGDGVVLSQRVLSMGCGLAVVDLVPVDARRRPVPTDVVARVADSIRVRLLDALACPDIGSSPLIPQVSLCEAPADDEVEPSCQQLLLTSPTVGGILVTF